MRDLLKEFEGDVKVVKEWFSDDSGKPIEKFVVTLHDKDYKAYSSLNHAMDRAIALSKRKRT